jgi:hypothetical protein
MEWHPFYYKGEETNIEVNELGEVRRVHKEWMKNKITDRLAVLTLRKQGYLQAGFKTKNANKVLEVHKIMAVVFLSHLQCGHKLVIDHIDGNKLNNNIKNLREVTHRINMINRKNISKYGTGVDYECGKYRVKIGINGKYLNLGRYDTPEEASKVYQLKLMQIEAGVFI